MDIRKLLDIINENSKPIIQGFESTPIYQFLIESSKLNRILKKKGIQIDNKVQAFKLFNDGYRIFAFHEMDDSDPFEIHDVSTLENYTEDSLLALPPDVLLYENNGELDQGEIEPLPFLKGIVDADTGTEIDLDSFYKLITGRPTRMLKQNEKMQHSDGTSDVFFNIGLPAIKGLVGDEAVGPPRLGTEDKSFLIINTCPGAGACKTFCYVGKGGYVQWKASSLGMTRMLNFLYNEPEQFMQQLSNEISETQKKLAKKGSNIIIRWHDAGDFFSPEYVKMAYEVAKKFPDITFYAYTKMINVAQGATPTNFVNNYSFGGKNDKKIVRSQIKHSDVVPKDLWSDLVVREKLPLDENNNFISEKLDDISAQSLSIDDLRDYLNRILLGKKDPTDKFHFPYVHKSNIPVNQPDAKQITDPKPSDQQKIKKPKPSGKKPAKSVLKYKDEQSIRELKNRIANYYKIDPNTLLTYDEYIRMPRTNELNKWNVIVKPGDGDVAASRRDVLGSYLLIH